MNTHIHRTPISSSLPIRITIFVVVIVVYLVFDIRWPFSFNIFISVLLLPTKRWWQKWKFPTFAFRINKHFIRNNDHASWALTCDTPRISEIAKFDEISFCHSTDLFAVFLVTRSNRMYLLYRPTGMHKSIYTKILMNGNRLLRIVFRVEMRRQTRLCLRIVWRLRIQKRQTIHSIHWQHNNWPAHTAAKLFIKINGIMQKPITRLYIFNKNCFFSPFFIFSLFIARARATRNVELFNHGLSAASH